MGFIGSGKFGDSEREKEEERADRTAYYACGRIDGPIFFEFLRLRESARSFTNIIVLRAHPASER